MAMTPDEELERFLAENVKGVAVDAQTIRSRAIRPPHREPAFSDHGSEGSTVLFEPTVPIVGLPYYLDVASFGTELEGYLQGTVAGYAAQFAPERPGRVLERVAGRQTAERRHRAWSGRRWNIRPRVHWPMWDPLIPGTGGTRATCGKAVAATAGICLSISCWM
jgi:hypothetical protein